MIQHNFEIYTKDPRFVNPDPVEQATEGVLIITGYVVSQGNEEEAIFEIEEVWSQELDKEVDFNLLSEQDQKEIDYIGQEFANEYAHEAFYEQQAYLADMMEDR